MQYIYIYINDLQNFMPIKINLAFVAFLVFLRIEFDEFHAA